MYQNLVVTLPRKTDPLSIWQESVKGFVTGKDLTSPTFHAYEWGVHDASWTNFHNSRFSHVMSRTANQDAIWRYSVRATAIVSLQWWMKNELRLKSLSSAVRNYPTIPVTSVPPERVLSVEGNVCNRRRASISPENLDAPVFLNANAKFIWGNPGESSDNWQTTVMVHNYVFLFLPSLPQHY